MSRYDDNRTRRVATLVCLVASWAVFISVADAEDPPKPRPAVDLDRLLDDLLRIDVAALRAKQDQLSKQVAETPAKAKALRDRAKGADQKAAVLRARLGVLAKLSAALKGSPPPGPAASAPKPATTQPAGEPNVDQLLDAMLKIDPKQLTAKQSAIEGEISQLANESKSMRGQAAAMEAQLAAAQRRLAILPKLIAAFEPPKVAAKQPPKPAVKPEAKPAPKKPAATPAPAPAMKTAPAPTPTPAATRTPVPATTQPAQAMKAAGAAKVVALNYQEHVASIFASRCTGCHNPDKSKGGLNLTTFASVIEGGSSGSVIAPGDAGGSRLFRLVSHAEQPNMPPLASKIPDEQLASIQSWIAQGAAASPESGPTAAPAAVIATTPRLKRLVTGPVTGQT